MNKKSTNPDNVRTRELRYATIERPGIRDDDLKDLESRFTAMDQESRNGHIYACYGVAMRTAQDLEDRAKTILYVYQRVSGVADTSVSYETVFDRRTLGQALKSLTTFTEFDPEADEIRRLSRSRRNFLAHSFFVSRMDDLWRKESQAAVVSELLTDAQLFRDFQSILDPLFVDLVSESGIDLEALYRSAETSVREKFNALH